MVPMHLGLIDGPLVPHTLISPQESPIPLPKIQMASGLKILISSGYMKGTQIYYPVLSLITGKPIPSSSPMGPLWREIPFYRAFLRLY
jgi:hypothetical protein